MSPVEAGHNFTLAQLMFFFMISERILSPGRSYWTVAFGRLKGDVLEDEEGINTVKDFGQRLAWLIKKINT